MLFEVKKKRKNPSLATDQYFCFMNYKYKFT